MRWTSNCAVRALTLMLPALLLTGFVGRTIVRSRNAYERALQDELASQTKKIVMYPLAVGGFVIAVMFFLMIYLVPQLTAFIKNMGNELPGGSGTIAFGLAPVYVVGQSIIATPAES